MFQQGPGTHLLNDMKRFAFYGTGAMKYRTCWPGVSPSFSFSDSYVDLQTNEGVLVPEPIRQTYRFTHQKDAHKNRQLSGQNQGGLLNVFQRGRARDLLHIETFYTSRPFTHPAQSRPVWMDTVLL